MPVTEKDVPRCLTILPESLTMHVPAVAGEVAWEE